MKIRSATLEDHPRIASALVTLVALAMFSGVVSAAPYVRDNAFSIEPPAGWSPHPQHDDIVAEAGRHSIPAPIASWEAPNGCGRLLITALPGGVTNLRRGLSEMSRSMTTSQPNTVALRESIERHQGQPMMVVEARRTVTDPVRQLTVLLPHRARPHMASYAVLERCWPAMAALIGASYRTFRELNPQNTERTYARTSFWTDARRVVVGAVVVLVLIALVQAARLRRGRS